MHFTWFEYLLGITYKQSYVATALFTTFLIVLISLVGRMALGKGEGAVTPSGKFSVKGVFEALVEFIDGLAQTVMGHHGRHFVPIFGAYFFYILFNNVFGLLPGMTAATANINNTLALGLFGFVVYNFYGFKENGMNYAAHFLGPVIWLAPLMLPVELISHLVRPFSLGIRLSVNMTGDHTILGVFLGLVPAFVPVAFYILGLFVSLVQAFIFTLLNMIYMSMAVEHDH